MKVKCGLEVMEMHEDDIAAVEQFLWGWVDFSMEEMEKVPLALPGPLSPDGCAV